MFACGVQRNGRDKSNVCHAALADKVGIKDFEHATLRAVAGIEKKRSILHGEEKTVVAKHEVGHALVSTAVAMLIPGSARVEKLSIVPRTGGALG